MNSAGERLCQHLKTPSVCALCGGCNGCRGHPRFGCGKVGTSKLDGHCVSCFKKLFPDDPRCAFIKDPSRGEKLAEEALRGIGGITFEPQADMGNQLKADFLITFSSGRQAILEMDGEQHHLPNRQFPGKSHEVQCRRDWEKEQEAARRNYDVWRISYLEYDNIGWWVRHFVELTRSADEPPLYLTSNAGLYRTLKDIHWAGYGLV